MILSESDTTQLLLDFTSIEFVTNIDNIMFSLGKWGYLGLKIQYEAARVANSTKPVLMLRKMQTQSNAGGVAVDNRSRKSYVSEFDYEQTPKKPQGSVDLDDCEFAEDE